MSYLQGRREADFNIYLYGRVPLGDAPTPPRGPGHVEMYEMLHGSESGHHQLFFSRQPSSKAKYLHIDTAVEASASRGLAIARRM